MKAKPETKGKLLKGLIMIITNDYLEKYKTDNGAWTRSQFEALGLEITDKYMPKKGWKRQVIGKEISEENARVFEARIPARKLNHAENKKKKDIEKLEKIRAYKKKFGITEELTQAQCTAVLSKSSKSSKRLSVRKKNKTKKQKCKERFREKFYESKAWRELRYKALKLLGRQCLCCGESPPNVVLHVDHIKPRSKYPELELDIDNLQILCNDCNLGKSNKDSIDYR